MTTSRPVPGPSHSDSYPAESPDHGARSTIEPGSSVPCHRYGWSPKRLRGGVDHSALADKKVFVVDHPALADKKVFMVDHPALAD
jgi:hypothetical protein